MTAGIIGNLGAGYEFLHFLRGGGGIEAKLDWSMMSSVSNTIARLHLCHLYIGGVQYGTCC